VVNGKNLGHDVDGGDIFVEITATTNDNSNFGQDAEMQKVQQNLKSLGQFSERTP
jgi:hypothetical protein